MKRVGYKLQKLAAATCRHDRFSLSIGHRSAAEAEAEIGRTSDGLQCMLLLEPNKIGLYTNSDSKLDADCAIHINSADKEALFVNSSSQIVADAVRVHGQSRLNSGSSVVSAPIEGVERQADPLAGLAEPAAGSCDFTDFTVNNGQTRTMTPGVYCKKTLVNSGATAIMLPGTYVFRDGPFEINSDAFVVGDRVMMHFQDKDAYLKVNSAAAIEVSAPTSGTYAGMLIFQRRHHENATAPSFIINSDSRTKLEGTIYLPHGTLEVNSLSTANQTAAYTAVVARNMVLNSLGTFNMRSDFDGETPLPPALAAFRDRSLSRLTR